MMQLDVGISEILAVLLSVVGSYLVNWANNIRFQAEVKMQLKNEQSKVAALEKRFENLVEGRLQDLDAFGKELHKISLALTEISAEIRYLKERWQS